jgi:hypothetical protein
MRCTMKRRSTQENVCLFGVVTCWNEPSSLPIDSPLPLSKTLAIVGQDEKRELMIGAKGLL